jgi:hypothetical protein
VTHTNQNNLHQLVQVVRKTRVCGSKRRMQGQSPTKKLLPESFLMEWQTKRKDQTHSALCLTLPAPIQGRYYPRKGHCSARQHHTASCFENWVSSPPTKENKRIYMGDGGWLAGIVLACKNLNIDGAPISARVYTHPFHSQTSRLLSTSLSPLTPPSPAPLSGVISFDLKFLHFTCHNDTCYLLPLDLR